MWAAVPKKKKAKRSAPEPQPVTDASGDPEEEAEEQVKSVTLPTAEASGYAMSQRSHTVSLYSPSHCLALSRSHTESPSLSHQLPHGYFLCRRLTPSRFIPRTCNLTAVCRSWSVGGRNTQDTRRNPSNGRTGGTRPKTEADQLWREAPSSSSCSRQA